MNNKICKKIREIIDPQDAITRKVYRRAKKQYMKTPKNLRSDFICSLEDIFKKDKD